jgi:lysophospholipase L1-like esterase
MKKRMYEGFVAITFIIVSPIACLLLVEVLGRVSGLLELNSAGTRFSATKGYELDPAYEHINSRGLRDREYPPLKPANTFRILALGDSFTYGAGVSSKETYVKQLEAMLNETPNDRGLRYEVLNAGVPGYNTHQELIHLREVGLQYNPDMILIGFTQSDAELGFFGMKGVEGRSWLIQVKEWMKNHIALYSFIKLRLKRLAEHFKAANLGTTVGGTAVSPLRLAVDGKTSPGWELCQQSLRDFGTLASERGIPIVLLIYPVLVNLDDTYPFKEVHTLIAKTATDYGMSVVDLLPDFIGQAPSTLWVSPRDGHPNASANAIAARGIYKALLAHKLFPGAPHPKSAHTTLAH